MTKKTNTWKGSITGTHNDLYWETDRNGRESAEVNDFAVRLDEEIKNISNLLKQKNKAYRDKRQN